MAIASTKWSWKVSLGWIQKTYLWIRQRWYVCINILNELNSWFRKLYPLASSPPPQTEEAENDVGTDDGSYNYSDMMKRDKRRWDYADQDKDGFLSKSEFGDFLHPEEVEHMKHIVVTETIEDIDKDKDGQISLLEYIGELTTRCMK